MPVVTVRPHQAGRYSAEADTYNTDAYSCGQAYPSYSWGSSSTHISTERVNPVRVINDKIDFDPQLLIAGEFYPVKYHGSRYLVHVDPDDKAIELYKL